MKKAKKSMSELQELISRIKVNDQEPDWKAIRNLFSINRDYIQLGASQFLVSHPQHIKNSIARYSRLLDEQPVLFTEEQENKRMQDVRDAAAAYMKVSNPDNIAITDSTTMGLGLIYTALNIQPGQEIITTDHDHYSHHESIRQAAGRTGAHVKRIALYKDLSKVTEEEIVQSVITAIDSRTRVIGLTWVHSSSGLKLPIPAISAAIKKLNKGRDEKNKVYMVLDGVHGFGIETESFDELGCDFFITSCHKWLYGPRGTGLIIATKEAWQLVNPVIPSYTDTMDVVIQEENRPSHMDGKQMTPGGFHSLEYRWALTDAFRFMSALGKDVVCRRVKELNRRCKEGLASMPHVILHTPMDPSFSSGIISFEINGLKTEKVVEKLKKEKVVATAAPYKISWPRFTPGIINSEEEVDRALEAVDRLRYP
jgi:selenocysteine lyase/cysteine desulfurase